MPGQKKFPSVPGDHESVVSRKRQGGKMEGHLPAFREGIKTPAQERIGTDPSPHQKMGGNFLGDDLLHPVHDMRDDRLLEGSRQQGTRLFIDTDLPDQ